MAGLFDRLIGADHISAHYFVAAFQLYGGGIYTSRIQILNAINSKLTTPLDAAAQTDFAAIADVFDGQPNQTEKLVYLNVIGGVLVATAEKYMDDAEWRSSLGIT